MADRLSAASGRTWHQSMVAKIESAARLVDYDELFPLAQALGLTVRELVEDSEEDPAFREMRLAELAVDNLEADRQMLIAQYVAELAALDDKLENAKSELQRLQYKDHYEQHRAEAL